MEVEHALHLSHDQFFGGIDQRQVGGYGQQDDGNNIENFKSGWFGLHNTPLDHARTEYFNDDFPIMIYDLA